MKKIIVYIITIHSLFLNAQIGFNSNTFIASRSDIETNFYKKDSTANALVLYEYGNSYVDKNEFVFILEEQQKIKILNKEGYKHATISVYLRKNNNKKESIENIFGFTHNLENGKIVKTRLLKENIFREEYNEDYDIVKFTLPNIKEGSVITYSYKIISYSMLNFRNWHFQGEIPRLYSEYETSIPENLDYNVQLVGKHNFFDTSSAVELNCLNTGKSRTPDCSKFVYIMKDVPAFIEEKHLTSRYNYLSHLEYKLKTFTDFNGYFTNYTKTWKDVDRELRDNENIGEQLSIKIKAEKILPIEIINEENTLIRATQIYKYVQENYFWNKKVQIFNDVSIKKLLENKSGNVASINILLHNLLKACNIKVKPVLLSTRGNGFASKLFPVIYDFNYMITQVSIDGKNFLLDATDKYLSFGQLPFKTLNHYGRLLDLKKGSEWIDISPLHTSSSNHMISLKLNKNQNLIGNVKSKYTGYIALNKKKKYYTNNENYLEKLENKSLNIKINNYNVTSTDKNSLDFSENYDVKHIAENTGDLI